MPRETFRVRHEALAVPALILLFGRWGCAIAHKGCSGSAGAHSANAAMKDV